MRAAILGVAVLASLLAVRGDAEDKRMTCSLVTGKLSIWNGWPPNLRIEASDGVVYGVPESDDGHLQIPERLVTQLAKGPVSGNFKICPNGNMASVPYDERPIVLVSIVDYDESTK
jgi:hypothetical protein